MRKYQSQKNNGFTLLELIVSMGIFLVVITAAVSAFLNVNDIEKKMSAFRAANDNINFAMETMAREIRGGDVFGMTSDGGYECSSSGGTIGFCADGEYDYIEFTTVESPERIAYKVGNCDLVPLPPLPPQCIKRGVDADASGTFDSAEFSDITSSDINITNLEFTVRGFAIPPDTKQPIVIINTEGVTSASIRAELKSKINIQTAVSLRQGDIEI